MAIEIIRADYKNPKHSREIGDLLDCYARDPMGGGAPLETAIKENLAARLSELPHAFSLILYVEKEPAGLANCFDGFSTFQCRPLVNIHDLVIVEQFRGRGLSQKLLQAIENIAVEKACCKITLEVLHQNKPARSSYLKFGFDSYELNPKAGKALFWHKTL